MEGLSAGAVESQKLTRFLRKKDLQAVYINHLRMRLLRLDTESPLELSSHAAASGFAPPRGGGRERGAAAAAAVEALASAGDCECDPRSDPNCCADAEGRAAFFQELAAERARILEAINTLSADMREIDEYIQRIVEIEGSHVNQYWGYMSRAGFADKSHLMRQIEKYADIYTSRVSNLLPYSPFKQFLCQRQSLAHQTTSYSGRPLMEHWQISDENLSEDLSKSVW